MAAGKYADWPMRWQSLVAIVGFMANDATTTQDRAVRMVLLSERAPTRVIVVGGDPVVGRALELLLRSVGYGARFATADSLDEPKLLDGVRLLLFSTVGLSPERREAAMSSLKSTPGMAGIPILKLVSSLDGAQAGEKDLIPWPCLVEELRRRIEAALVGGERPTEREVSHD